ncbi:MAG: hypothetical protein QXV22_02675 [Thermoplasmataceae archaeon]
MPNNYVDITESIQKVKSYKKLLAIKDDVTENRNEYPDYVAKQIVDMVNQRLDFFEHPRCNEVGITLILMNGSRRKLSQHECQETVDSGERLSEYVYRRYPMAVDFELAPLDPRAAYLASLKNSMDKRNIEYAQIESMNSKIDVVGKLIKTLEENMSTMIPRLSNEVREIRKRVTDLSLKIRSRDR